MNKGEKPKTNKIRRIRKSLNSSIDPENYEYLKENGIKASRLADKAIYELRKIKPPNLVLISEKNPESWAR